MFLGHGEEGVRRPGVLCDIARLEDEYLRECS